MTLRWNVPISDIDAAIAPLRPDADAEDRLDTFAHAAWSFLVEPGDRVAASSPFMNCANPLPGSPPSIWAAGVR